MSIVPINLIKGKPREDRQQIDMECSINELLEKLHNMSNRVGAFIFVIEEA